MAHRTLLQPSPEAMNTVLLSAERVGDEWWIVEVKQFLVVVLKFHFLRPSSTFTAYRLPSWDPTKTVEPSADTVGVDQRTSPVTNSQSAIPSLAFTAYNLWSVEPKNMVEPSGESEGDDK